LSIVSQIMDEHTDPFACWTRAVGARGSGCFSRSRKQHLTENGDDLIVEDEAKMRRLLELSLGEDGFRHAVRSRCRNGLKYLREEVVDLVVTDLKLRASEVSKFLQTAKRLNGALPSS